MFIMFFFRQFFIEKLRNLDEKTNIPIMLKTLTFFKRFTYSKKWARKKQKTITEIQKKIAAEAVAKNIQQKLQMKAKFNILDRTEIADSNMLLSLSADSNIEINTETEQDDEFLKFKRQNKISPIKNQRSLNLIPLETHSLNRFPLYHVDDSDERKKNSSAIPLILEDKIPYDSLSRDDLRKSGTIRNYQDGYGLLPQQHKYTEESHGRFDSLKKMKQKNKLSAKKLEEEIDDLFFNDTEN